MKKILIFIYIIFSVLFLYYLFLPNPSFPNPLDDSLQSNEPADTETPLRRAYFTNYTREEVMQHYENQFKWPMINNTSLLTYRLNYPPEESQAIIRDQTRSTFLEEIVHPFRESIYVNGFEPKDPKDAVIIDGRVWRQKIIIKYVPSTFYIRLVLGLLTLASIVFIYKNYRETILKIKKQITYKWNFR